MEYVRNKKGIVKCYNSKRLQDAIYNGLVTMQETGISTRFSNKKIYSYGVTRNGNFLPSYFRSEFSETFYKSLTACINSDDPKIKTIQN